MKKKSAAPVKAKAKKELNVWKILVFPLAVIIAILVITVIVIALLPTFRVLKMSGTYYGTYDPEVDTGKGYGQLNYSVSFSLSGGRWEITDGRAGTYKIFGGELILSGNDSAEQPLHYHARVENGLLVIEGEKNEVFVSENHEHEYGESVTMESVNGSMVVVEKISNCFYGGYSVQFCKCGGRKSTQITSRSHWYDTEMTKEATCAEGGEEIRTCRICSQTERIETPRTWIHKEFTGGKCSVCGIPQLSYELSADGTHYVVTGFSVGEKKGFGIMESYEGLPVTEIAENAFNGLSYAVDFEIPAFITKIGEGAFRGGNSHSTISVDKENPVYRSEDNCLIETASKTLLCGYPTNKIPSDGSVTKIRGYAFTNNGGLTSLEIPDCITEIEGWAFKSCTSLKRVRLPNGLKEISTSLFYGCIELESVTIQSGAEIIEQNAFHGCTKLKEIYIPEGVRKINGEAFENCTGLVRVTLPASLTYLSDRVFEGCTGLKEISVREGGYIYHSAGNCIINTPKRELILACYPFEIPSDGSVKTINDSALLNCRAMESVVIPKQITQISPLAFSGCTALTRIAVEEGNPVYHSAGNCLIETATGTLIKGTNASAIPTDGSVTKIGDHAFSGCSGLADIALPDSITELGRGAFLRCSGLKSVTLPESLKSIGEEAFWGCSLLESIVIPNSVKVIEKDAFKYCNRLTSITLPCGISLPEGNDTILSSCSAMKEVHFGGTKSEWSAIANKFVFAIPQAVTVYCTDGEVKAK